MLTWWQARKQLTFSIIFLEQLSCLLGAGIPVTRALEMLEKSQHDLSVRAALFKMRQQLLSGRALHQCARLLPEWFDDYAIQLIALGERTGKLENVLSALSQRYSKKQALIRKLASLLFYPCLIFFSALLMTAAMFIFVIPAFAEWFQGTTQPLPWLTRYLFQISKLINHLLPVGLVIFSCLAMFYYLQRHFKITVFILKVPEFSFLRRMIQVVGVIRFTEHLALALSAGMPMLDALQLCTAFTSHAALNRQLRELQRNVTAGASLSRAAEPLTLIPTLLKQMMKTGEESGCLDALLMKAANMLQMELENHITQLTTLLEPLIMVILGALIGGLVVGMYLPVFNLGSVL